MPSSELNWNIDPTLGRDKGDVVRARFLPTVLKEADLTTYNLKGERKGQMVYCEDSTEVKVWNGTAWQDILFGSLPTRTIILTAGGGTPTTTTGCTDVAKLEFGTNDVDVLHLSFADAVSSAFWTLPMPDNYAYTSSPLTARFYWTCNAAGASGTVAWGIKCRAFQDDDSLDLAYGTEVVTTDTLIALNDLHVTQVSSSITPAYNASPSPPFYMQFKVTRQSGSDTLNGAALLLAVKIEYETTSLSD
jgi:hypothetical protein